MKKSPIEVFYAISSSIAISEYIVKNSIHLLEKYFYKTLAYYMKKSSAFVLIAFLTHFIPFLPLFLYPHKHIKKPLVFW